MESKVMTELRKTRDEISEEIKEMNAVELNEYFKKKSKPLLDEINQIRKQKQKAI